MKQSNLLYGLVAGVSMLASTSCVDSSFLNETQTTDLSKEVIFSDSTYTVGFLNHLYEDEGFDVHPTRFGQGGLQTACDEAEYKITSNSNDGIQFVTGTVNPVTISEDTWRRCYSHIRSANVFLANVDVSPMAESAKVRYKAEARFMRAWYYFILLRHYGGVPLLGDEVYTNENFESINMTRASFADCVNYIVDECNAAAAELPNRRSGTSYGRASAGSCMGLISRVLLYAASPLYNGTTFTTDERLRPLVGYPEADDTRWKDAADAARRLIATGQWQVYIRHQDNDGNDEPGWGFYGQTQGPDYTSITSGDGFTYASGALCGSILGWIREMGQSQERMFDPVSCGGSGDAGYPTHDLVECFPMKDGAKPGEGKYTYDPMNPDQNRDPRFKNCIIWNGAVRMAGGDAGHIVYTYQGVGSTNDAIYQGTRTGYYACKMSHRATAGNYFVAVPQLFNLIRYEEILLNYAEAINEYYGPDHVEVLGTEELSPYTVLRLIRRRAGIEPGDNGEYGIPNGLDKAGMREAIRLERRIELALEGHRFFDVRRWKIAEQTDNGYTHAFEISKKLDGTISSRVVNSRQHVFRTAMYFWPIPYNEVVRSEQLLQNPYYE